MSSNSKLDQTRIPPSLINLDNQMEDYRAQQRKICLNCFERGCQGECMAVWSEPGMPERKTFGWPGLFALLAIAFFVVLVVLKIVEGYQ